MTDNKQDPHFDVCLEENDLREVLARGKLTLLITYDCSCFDEQPRASQVFDLCSYDYLGNKKPITARDVVDFLTQIDYDPACNHRMLESIEQVRTGLVELFMGE